MEHDITVLILQYPVSPFISMIGYLSDPERRFCRASRLVKGPPLRQAQ
jgi:hypothetical protein